MAKKSIPLYKKHTVWIYSENKVKGQEIGLKSWNMQKKDVKMGKDKVNIHG